MSRTLNQKHAAADQTGASEIAQFMRPSKTVRVTDCWSSFHSSFILNTAETRLIPNLQPVVFLIDDDFDLPIFRAEISFLLVKFERQFIVRLFDDAVFSFLRDRRIAGLQKLSARERPF